MSSTHNPGIWNSRSPFDNRESLYADECRCCFATHEEKHAFWQIDLGQQYRVYAIELLSRADIAVKFDGNKNITRTGNRCMQSAENTTLCFKTLFIIYILCIKY